VQFYLHTLIITKDLAINLFKDKFYETAKDS